MLSCFFKLGWGEKVYTVNWYRNGHEFYRYSPGEDPRIQTFSQPGIFVDVSNVDLLMSWEYVQTRDKYINSW